MAMLLMQCLLLKLLNIRSFIALIVPIFNLILCMVNILVVCVKGDDIHIPRLYDVVGFTAVSFTLWSGSYTHEFFERVFWWTLRDLRANQQNLLSELRDLRDEQHNQTLREMRIRVQAEYVNECDRIISYPCAKERVGIPPRCTGGSFVSALINGRNSFGITPA